PLPRRTASDSRRIATCARRRRPSCCTRRIGRFAPRSPRPSSIACARSSAANIPTSYRAVSGLPRRAKRWMRSATPRTNASPASCVSSCWRAAARSSMSPRGRPHQNSSRSPRMADHHPITSPKPAASNATNLWSGRFDAAPDAAAFDFGASFRFDRRLFEDDVTGSLAWARALSRAGVLASDEAAQIDAALADLLERGRSDPAFVSGADEDVHSFVERMLVERLGDAGRRLHTGRSRNEQVSLDLRLYLRRRIPLL